VGQSFELGINTLMCRSVPSSWSSIGLEFTAATLALQEVESATTQSHMSRKRRSDLMRTRYRSLGDRRELLAEACGWNTSARPSVLPP
jgi:hypothetical protein